MSNIINFERDMFWSANVSSIAPGSTSFNGDEVQAVNDGVVGDRTSFATANFGFAVPASGSVTDVYCYGALILPPADGDNTPFRVKGACFSPENNPVAWGVGYYEGTGSTLIQRCQLLGAGPTVDELWCGRPLQTGDANFGDPLCFFMMVSQRVADNCCSSLSVQRLISKPPQFATAVS